MIGQIKGKLVYKQAPDVLVDVSGVGYELQVPMTTYYDLPGLGQEVTLITHLAIRDDAHVLYGFSDFEQRHLFRDLIKVNGIGPKLGLTILSGISTPDLLHAVFNNDASALVKLPGVGKKTAERMLIELKDKLKDYQDGADVAQSDAQQTATARRDDPVAEAVQALISLGFKPQDASRSVAKVAKPEHDSEKIIREALKAQMK